MKRSLARGEQSIQRPSAPAMAVVASYLVRSLSHYVELTEALRDSWGSESGAFFDVWYRGQRRAGWLPKPSLYVHDLAHHEDDLRDGFQRRAIQLSPELGRVFDQWEWYFLMQHHGTPTRLLDWSDGSLIALYFALQPSTPSSRTATHDAVVGHGSQLAEQRVDRRGFSRGG